MNTQTIEFTANEDFVKNYTEILNAMNVGQLMLFYLILANRLGETTIKMCINSRDSEVEKSIKSICILKQHMVSKAAFVMLDHEEINEESTAIFILNYLKRNPEMKNCIMTHIKTGLSHVKDMGEPSSAQH